MKDNNFHLIEESYGEIGTADNVMAARPESPAEIGAEPISPDMAESPVGQNGDGLPVSEAASSEAPIAEILPEAGPEEISFEATQAEAPIEEQPREDELAESALLIENPLEITLAEPLSQEEWPQAPEESLPTLAPWWKRLWDGRSKKEDGVMTGPTMTVALPEIEPGVVVEETSSTLAPTPQTPPWWKRLWGGRSEKEDGVMIGPTMTVALPEIEPGVVVEETSPTLAPTPQTPPWWKRLWGGRSETVSLEIPEPEEQPAAEVIPTTPSFTLDDVRTLVQAELVRSQDDITRMAQTELSHQQNDRHRALLTSAQEVAESVYTVKADLLRMELEALQAEQQTLQDRSWPLRELMEEVDYIRERIAKAEQEIIQVEATAARRVDEATSILAELEGGGIVADLRQELEQQKAVLPTLVQQAVVANPAAQSESRARGGILWLTALALVLAVAAAGVTGFLLLRNPGTDPNLLIEMATVYQVGNKTEEAIRVLDEAVQTGISDPAMLGRVGETYRLLKQYDKAITVLNRAVTQEPQNQAYLLSLARSYGSNRQHQEAITHYQTLLQLVPNNVRYYLEIGQRYRSLKNYDLALAQYQKTLEIDSKYWQGYYYQAEIYREQQKYNEAIGLYQKALEINSTYYESRLNAGQSYAGKGDYERALEQYQAAITLKIDRAEAYYYLGEVYLAQGQFNEAIAPYQQAIERNPRYTEAYVGLGKVYLLLEDCSKAAPQFIEALKIAPNSVEAQEGLTACAEK